MSQTRAVLDALIRHYRKPGGDRDGEVLIPEVKAPGSNRRCDLVRVGMWASRGTGIDVHEIKVSRSDWLRELDDPEKADAWWRFCNRFWVVALPGIVVPAELPAGWGLLELPRAGRRFKTVVRAESKEAELSLPLVIELLRRTDNQRLAEMDQMREGWREDKYKIEREARAEGATAGMSPDLRKRLEFLDRLEQATGCKATDWSWEGNGRLDEMTAGELAVILADARDGIAAQRRALRNAIREAALRNAVARVLKELDEEPQGASA